MIEYNKKSWGVYFNETGILDELIIAKFASIKDAVRATGLNQSLIVAVCRGTRNHTGGYIFEYENKDLIK